ncbi:hypothetical protein GN956_G13894 [Arapaima gigas]
MKEKIKFLLWVSVSLNCLWCRGAAGTSVVVKEGQKAALDCFLTPDNRSRTVSWYKQYPGEGPQFILSYELQNISQLSYGPGFDSSRFSVGTKEDDAQRHQLQISAATRSDAAVYYCLLAVKDFLDIGTNHSVSR